MTEETFMIESLWILDKESGICIFEENYTDITKEGTSTDLISAFLSAILSFANETFTDEIKHIQFSNHRILFEFSDSFLFVIAVSAESPESDSQIHQIVDTIAKKFNEKYSPQVIGEWKGQIELFNGFSDDLRTIVKKEPISAKFLQVIDPREHFKRLETFINRRKEDTHKKVEKIENFLKNKLHKKKVEKKLKNLLENMDKE